MSVKPSSVNVLVLFLITLSIGVGYIVGCGDDDNDPVGPTPPTTDPYALGMSRTDWTLASSPPQYIGDPHWSRGTIRWHNPPAIARSEVYGSGTGSLTPLRLIFRPRGKTVVGPPDDPCFMVADTRSWGGIMCAWSGGLPPNYIRSGTAHLEMRIKPTGGVLHFDFGRINENIDGDDCADNEDQSQPPNRLIDYDPQSGVIEDTGLDTLLDEDEVGRCLQPYDPVTNPDPAGDNWWFEGYGKGTSTGNLPPVAQEFYMQFQNEINDATHRLHYEWINGTEGNVNDDAVQGQPDREDLAWDGLNILDAYLSYEIDLTLTDTTHPYEVPGSGYNGWYTYRIPVWPDTLSDTVRSHPALEIDWEYFTHVRVWFEQSTPGLDSLQYMDSLWIADWRLVSD